MKKAKFRKLLKYTAKYCNKGNLLDFGCGPGYLMEEAKKIGFNVNENLLLKELISFIELTIKDLPVQEKDIKN